MTNLGTLKVAVRSSHSKSKDKESRVALARPSTTTSVYVAVNLVEVPGSVTLKVSSVHSFGKLMVNLLPEESEIATANKTMENIGYVNPVFGMNIVGGFDEYKFECQLSVVVTQPLRCPEDWYDWSRVMVTVNNRLKKTLH